MSEQEGRTLKAFCRHFSLEFNNIELLRLALTHRSYLSVTKGTRESNERLEFLGDSVLGLVTSEYLYQRHPDEHEGQLTKTKSLLVSKAILSRRSLAMGLGRFVLMSHSEIESGGRQRLSILADAFEAVLGAIYLDQGFEASRSFIERWLLSNSSEIVADKRHTNYKSHLQEYVQSTFRTHPVYRIRREVGPDHSKQFHVEVIVGRRTLGSGSGANKKEAEQAAARDALERVEQRNLGTSEQRRGRREAVPVAARPAVEVPPRTVVDEAEAPEDDESARRRRRGRRGGRGRRSRSEAESESRVTRTTERRPAPDSKPAPPTPPRVEQPVAEVGRGGWDYDDEFEEVGRPEGPLEERHIDLYGVTDENETPEPRAIASDRDEGAESGTRAEQPSVVDPVLSDAPVSQPDTPGHSAFEDEVGEMPRRHAPELLATETPAAEAPEPEDEIVDEVSFAETEAVVTPHDQVLESQGRLEPRGEAAEDDASEKDAGAEAAGEESTPAAPPKPSFGRRPGRSRRR